jgi:hypothetical protein
MSGETHVIPHPSGGWDVVVPGAGRVDSHHATQREAEHRAKSLLRDAHGGEAVIHRRDGRIRDSDYVAAVRRS